MHLRIYSSILMSTLILVVTMFNSYTMKAQQMESTPVIDREIFFGNPEISSGELSPNGQYVSFMKEYNGIMNLWVKSFDEEFNDAKLLTESNSPILGHFWTYDSKYIVFLNDNNGDENLNIFAVDPTQAEKGSVPESRNLTPLDEVAARIYDVSRKDPDLMMIGLNDRDKAWHDLYKLRISTGEIELILKNENRYTGYDFDWDENLRLAYRTDENGNSQILRVDKDGSFKELYSTDISESAYVAGWTPDNQECYLVSNKGEVDLSTLYKMNPEDGSLEMMESDPKNKVDFGGLFINSHTREIISTSYTYDKRVRYFKDPEWEKTYEFLKSKFPDRSVGFTSFTKEYDKMLVAVSGDKYATEVYFFDRESKDLIQQYTPRPKLKEVESALSTMEPISYRSSDGLDIPAYLSIPAGKEAKNLPVVVFVHGGPKGPRDTWGYNGRVQFLNNRGYAVLQPNFRASGGYGKSFLNAGDKQWGKLMQDDITWGVKHLVDQGIADPDKIAIMGGSYGGYATLAGLAFTPELYTCGVDIVGPSNLFTLLESIPAYWEAGREWLYEMVGDPETEEGQKLLREASPLFSADKINKPLMIVQGANDPRVKKAEADQIVVALRDKGHPVQYLCADDEGHGFRKPLNRMAMYAEVEKFLAAHLGGRYQEEVGEEIKEALDKITVDISTVELPEALSDEDMNRPLPSIAYAPNNQNLQYKMTISMGAQNMEMKVSRTIESMEGQIKISSLVESPMMNMTEELLLNDELQPIKKSINQGPVAMDFEFNEDEVTGVINMQGKAQNVQSDLNQTIWDDNAGMYLALSSIELKEGEEMLARVYDGQKNKVVNVKLAVEGIEKVEVPAGKFDAYKILATDLEADNTKTIYVGNKKGQRMVVKVKSTIPEMGGAKAELLLTSM